MNGWTYLFVATGGALGSVGRFWLSNVVTSRWGDAWPWGTLLVNVTGSFVIGLFAALTAPEGSWPAPPLWRQFFMTGICGGYTTFSAFSLQTLGLLREREYISAGANIVLSIVLCLLAVWLGHLAGSLLAGNRAR